MRPHRGGLYVRNGQDRTDNVRNSRSPEVVSGPEQRSNSGYRYPRVQEDGSLVSREATDRGLLCPGSVLEEERGNGIYSRRGRADRPLLVRHSQFRQRPASSNPPQVLAKSSKRPLSRSQPESRSFQIGTSREGRFSQPADLN